MRCFRFALAILAFCIVPLADAHAKTIPTISHSSTVTAVHQAPVAPLGDLTAPLALIGFAFVGATAPKSRKMNLSRSYLFNGQTFGPGNDISVPGDFPDIDGETGDVIFEEGSTAAINQERARGRSFSSPPSTGGVNTGETGGGSPVTVSGRTPEELESMTKDQLVELATDLNIDVAREDGGDGEPLKADYVMALGATRNDSTATPKVEE